MPWILLLIAGLFEIVWAVSLKNTEGFSRLWPTAFTLAMMSVSVFLLSRALVTIPVGAGYAVWTGIGATGTALVGMLFLGESRDLLRVACIGLIVLGIVGLKFSVRT